MEYPVLGTGNEKKKKTGENPQTYKKTVKIFRHLLLKKAEGYADTLTKKRKSTGAINKNSIHRILFYR